MAIKAIKVSTEDPRMLALAELAQHLKRHESERDRFAFWRVFLLRDGSGLDPVTMLAVSQILGEPSDKDVQRAKRVIERLPAKFIPKTGG